MQKKRQAHGWVRRGLGDRHGEVAQGAVGGQPGGIMPVIGTDR